MEITTFAPVLIPTLNRYEHFRRCVESLSRCTYAEKTELVIGLDFPPSEKYVEGWKKICEYVNTITGFGKVTVFRREENYGVHKNFDDLKKYASGKYDVYIVSEDDNEFSPCFLDYMNKALGYYRNNPLVISICGYNLPISAKGYNKSVFASQNLSAWGVARWVGKEQFPIDYSRYCMRTLSNPRILLKIWKKDRRMIGSLIDSAKNGCTNGDRIWTLKCLIEDKYCICPTLSLVRNTGHDGSGIHCGKDETNVFSSQVISKLSSFQLDTVDIKYNIMYKRQSSFFNGGYKSNILLLIRIFRYYWF